jgi:ABC-type multidrug transport system ATPase subunit
MNAIEFRNVTLTLGGRAVLAGVSLKIAPRELVGVLGPNGAGKTTLMRAVLGLVPASQGSIHVLGRPAARGNQMVGNVLAVDIGTVWTLLAVGVVIVAALAIISRPLLFASL